MRVLFLSQKYMKCLLSWFFILAVIISGVWFFSAERAHAPVAEVPSVPEIKNPKLSPETANIASQMIEVTMPSLNATISSPLSITGRARGPWYFEAIFPIELQKNDGTVIASVAGQAQGDWMTENWVPFTATLTFPAQPTGSLGKLVLKKDNPSGEPANDMSIIVPVQF